MKTLDSIREEVAEREGFCSWDALILAVESKYVPVGVLDVLITDIATMYAKEAIKETIITAKHHMGCPEDFDDEGTEANTLTQLK